MNDPYVTRNPDKATDEPDGNPDTAMVPYVEALRAEGIETYQSCAGHGPDGQSSDAHLWFESDAMAEGGARYLAQHDGFHSVCRRYAREDCWEVVFAGMNAGEGTFREHAEELAAVLGITAP